MPGGLMQLVAYGAQDVYLTGNPQKTFFKNSKFRRYTNFACEETNLDDVVSEESGNQDVENDLVKTRIDLKFQSE